MATRTGAGVGSVARPLGRAGPPGAARPVVAEQRRQDDDDADADADVATGQPRPGAAAADASTTPADDFAERPGRPARRLLKARGAGRARPRPARGRAVGAVDAAADLVPPPHGGADRSTGPRSRPGAGCSRSRSSQHGVDTSLVGMTVGPTVTRYELELGPGVKVARVTSLQRDIAYAMAATDVRILAPIPGRSAIGVEVPNHTRQLVALGDLLVSPEARAATGPLDVAIGKDIAGKSVFLDLATTPHLLIAGATGAGKSSGINCIITSLLMRTTPDQVRLILVDPKQVEMGQYNRLPHLLTQPVTNPKKAANALGWAVKEMERRYDLLSEVGFRDIGGYNAAFDRGELSAEPGDRGPRPVRPGVRAAAVHRRRRRRAQRPDDGRRPRRRGVDHPHRPEGPRRRHPPHRRHAAAERERDHRRHQGQHPGPHRLRRVQPHRLPRHPRPAGRREARRQGRHAAAARQLLGRPARPGLVRRRGGGAQGRRPLAPPGARGHLRQRRRGRRRRTDADDHVTSSANAFSAGGDDDDEAMMRQAMELVVRSQLGSTSMLQRKLKVGFARAGRIMDLLEQRGVVGPSEGSKARAVLMTVEEYELGEQAGRDVSAPMGWLEDSAADRVLRHRPRPAGAAGSATRSRSGSASSTTRCTSSRATGRRPTGTATCKPTPSSRCASTGAAARAAARVVDDPDERRRVGDVMGAKYVWGGDPSIGLTYEAWCYDVPAVAIELGRDRAR